MKLHGISHGGAVLGCMVLSSLLIEVAKEHLPSLFEATEKLVNFLVESTGIPSSADQASMILLAGVLAFLWGVLFYYLHED